MFSVGHLSFENVLYFCHRFKILFRWLNELKHLIKISIFFALLNLCLDEKKYLKNTILKKYVQKFGNRIVFSKVAFNGTTMRRFDFSNVIPQPF